MSKLDSSGNLVWAGKLGGTSFDEGFGVAVDGSGNVYTTGYFFGTADFDPGGGTSNLTSAGTFDVFVSKLNSSGNLVWARQLGGVIGYGVAVDGSGNVYTTGYFFGTGDFDPGAGTFDLTPAGEYDVFVSKLDSFGEPGVGSPGWAALAATSAVGWRWMGRATYTTGSFSGTADFDPVLAPPI